MRCYKCNEVEGPLGTGDSSVKLFMIAICIC